MVRGAGRAVVVVVVHVAEHDDIVPPPVVIWSISAAPRAPVVSQPTVKIVALEGADGVIAAPMPPRG
ncbi:MAG: hypothetical protein R3F11_18845 [Verrucomicrobiales bacterium]